MYLSDTALVDDDAPADAGPVRLNGGDAVAMPRNVYGVNQQPNLPAMGVSVLATVVLLAGLATLGTNLNRKPPTKPTVVQLLPEVVDLPPPPPPPRPQPVNTPVETHAVPTPVVAPVPVVQMPIAPVPIQTSPTPPTVETPTPGPPAPAPSPPAPSAIENAGDLSSQMIAADPPRYPTESRRLREQGTVVLMVLLNLDGRVSEVSIQRSSGHSRLDQAALSAVRRWRWSPTRRNGVAVMVRGVVEIPFVLR